MAVPKKRKTKSAKRQRRSHHGLSSIKLGRCANCGAAALPHRVCQNCGAYRGKLQGSEQKKDKPAKKESAAK